MAVFKYDYKTNCNPIPPAEQGLPTVTAERFLHVTDVIPHHLEGVCFDQTGENMYFCATDIGRVYHYNFVRQELKEIWKDAGLRSFGLKRHRDGRLFVACFGRTREPGLVILSPDGKEMAHELRGMELDDFCFCADGSFYTANFIGNIYDRVGKVFHVSSDCQTVTMHAANLAGPNGIALSPDEKILWITEYCGGRLLRTPVGGGWGSAPYAFTGYHGPDSCEIDGNGNLYVAMTFQGRILIFNRDGFPIGQVLMPERELGKNLISTHATVRPGTKELYITCSDDSFGGSWIMRSEAFAEPCMTSFSLS